jgi:protein phosphatase
MEEGGPVLMDLLWSDPTTNDGVQGVQPSPRGPGLVTFGPDRVKDFCKVRRWGSSGLLTSHHERPSTF